MEVDSPKLIAMLEDKITLYRHLGIEVVTLSSEQVHFKVSLEKNLNHKGTAFGGSLYATGVLAAYAMTLAGLKKRGFQTENIVIAKGEIQYLRPVESDFEVYCSFESPTVESSFFTALKENGKARGALKSYIKVGGSLKAVLVGEFVVKI